MRLGHGRNWEELREARTETGDGIHVLASIVADHLEHALDGLHHLREYAKHAVPLRRRLAWQLLEQILHGPRHRGDHGIAVKSRRTFEPVSHYHERAEHLRGGRITRGQSAHAFLDGGHGIPGFHQEDAENEVAVLVVQHPGFLRASSGPRPR